MPTTTKTKTLAERLQAMEASHVEKAELVAARYAELSEAAPSAKRAVEDAEDHLSEVEAGLARGADGVTADDLGTAENEVRAARLRFDNLEREFRRATKPVNRQVEGALGLVPLIREALPKVPIWVTAATSLPELVDLDAPLAILRQTEASVSTSGALRSSRERSGVTVELVYVRSIIHRVWDYREFNETARRRGLRVEASTFGRSTNPLAGTDLQVDVFRLTVAEVSAVPVVEENSVAPAFSDLVSTAIASGVDGMTVKGTEVQTPTYVDNGGIRTVTVTGSTELKPRRSSAKSGSAQDLVGEFFAGMGRVTNVSVTNLGDTRKWVLTLTSRTGHDVPLPGMNADVLGNAV